MNDSEMRAFATGFFDAIERGDIPAMQACFTPDAEIWHNTDELIVSPADTAKVLAGMVARISDPRYADRRINVFAGGFVQQHVLEGKRVHDGGAVRLPCAIICKVTDGRITRLDEYFDSAHVAEFRKYAQA
ncbi:nuclear transport factor 2 family protein [uncultured Sphingomonas sp.]|uniref:nuclear transport factor 2 family protein n=1 Tax=uncultured Sphingomonas sp. TaxID=158754 RepID=UPI002628EFE3|nr:nuclear transport factor 2 family protein [uncultured Sphingomonas sp.]